MATRLPFDEVARQQLGGLLIAQSQFELGVRHAVRVGDALGDLVFRAGGQLDENLTEELAAAALFLLADAHPLATLNASLNALAAVLLVVGYVLILRRHERAHRNVMLAAFAVSVAFLTSYLAYHVWPVGAKATPFPGQGLSLILYRVILVSHIILAAAVPFLAMRTI